LHNCLRAICFKTQRLGSPAAVARWSDYRAKAEKLTNGRRVPSAEGGQVEPVLGGSTHTTFLQYFPIFEVQQADSE
jgi:hypothetical protein